MSSDRPTDCLKDVLMSRKLAPTNAAPDHADAESRLRRRLVLLISIVLLSISAGVSWKFGDDSTARSAASGSGRVGLVMAALWLAWPSLRRPAAWLPPSIAVGGVIALAVVAFQPRLIVVVIPATGVLFTLAAAVRAIRRK